MISPGVLNDRLNPYDEATPPFDKPKDFSPFDFNADPVRVLGSLEVQLMQQRPHEVRKGVTASGGIALTQLINCTAPFVVNAGIYTTSTDALDTPGWTVNVREPAQLLLRAHIHGNDIMRWIQLRHPEGRRFGVQHLSREQEDGFEQWDLLTLAMRAQGGEATGTLWARTINTDGTERDKRLNDDGGWGHKGYHFAMYHALDRTLKKRSGKRR